MTSFHLNCWTEAELDGMLHSKKLYGGAIITCHCKRCERPLTPEEAERGLCGICEFKGVMHANKA